MKLNLLLPFAFMFFGFITTTKSSAATDTVSISRGYGETEKAALENAIQNAIETSKGIHLLSTTEIQNSQLTKDQITTARQGYSYSFKKISSIQLPSAGGMYEVDAKVWVSSTNKILTTSSTSDSIDIFLESMKTKKDRIAEMITFIAKWLQVHNKEYGYNISNITESSNNDGYSNVTFKPVSNPVFKATLAKLIDKLNTFSNKRYSLEFVDFVDEGSFSMSECRAEDWNKASVTLTYDLSDGRLPTHPSSYITLNSDNSQTLIERNGNFYK